MTVTVESPRPRLPASAEVMRQAREENFPVAALVLGRAVRRHVKAVYGFARLLDDAGDEGRGDRSILLDEVDAELSRVYGAGQPEHPLMRALKLTVAECRLPEEPFRRLVEANRVDQVKTRYATFDELLGYCRLSAAPVGALVLHIFGAATPRRLELSERVCAALQVIEHLQDVGEDYARGRVYLPRADLERFGCDERQLSAPAASPELRGAVALLAHRCHRLLDDGAPLARQLPPRARLAVGGFLAGGRATLTAIERSGYDVLAGCPRASRSALGKELWPALMGR